MSGIGVLKPICNKGFRPIHEAIKDEKYLQENASTGQSWYWENRRGDIIYFN